MIDLNQYNDLGKLLLIRLYLMCAEKDKTLTIA